MLPVLFSGNVRDILSDEKKGMCQKTPPNSLYRTGKLEALGLVVSGRSILHAVVPFGVGVSLSLLLPSVVFLNKLFNLSEPLLYELY